MADEWVDEVGSAFKNPMAGGGQISTFVDPYGARSSSDPVKEGTTAALAGRAVVMDRAEHYGDPKPNHDRIAALWSAWLGVPITAHDVAWMMVLVKGSRSKVDPSYGDNYTDGHGYLDIAKAVA